MIELRSPDGLARAIILPEYGGRLHQLFVTVDRAEEALLWSPQDPAEYAERPTRGGSFPMAPWPNRIANGRFTWEGREYQVPLDGKPHAIHGRVYNKAWRVASLQPDECTLACELDDGWPWEGTVEQTFLMWTRRLEVCLLVNSEEVFPVGLGWHPWLRRDAFGASDVRVTVPADARYVLESNLPTGQVVPVEGVFDLRAGPSLGERRLDDCYRDLSGDVVIDWGRLKLGIELHMPGQELTPHVQVFTPPEALCVEPQTCAVDAFNLAARGSTGTGLLTSAQNELGGARQFWMMLDWSAG